MVDSLLLSPHGPNPAGVGWSRGFSHAKANAQAQTLTTAPAAQPSYKVQLQPFLSASATFNTTVLP